MNNENEIPKFCTRCLHTGTFKRCKQYDNNTELAYECSNCGRLIWKKKEGVKTQ